MKKYMFFVFALSILFSACQKEEIKIDELDDILDGLVLKSVGDEVDRGDDGKCFEILFPLSLNMPDGTVVDGDTRKELHEAVKIWFKENRKANRKDISFHFPLSVNFKGKILSLESEQQLQRVRMACKGEGYDDKDKDLDKVPCIEMLYPVSYSLPTGRILTANSPEELKRLMTAWKEAHPDSRKGPSLVYPVNLKFKGEEMTIENEQQMLRIKNACAGKIDGDKDKDKDKDKKNCFELVYPLTYEMPGGMMLTRDSKEDMDAAMKRWYTANKTDEKPVLQFPVKIKYVSGKGDKIVDIEDNAALRKAYADCGK